MGRTRVSSQAPYLSIVMINNNVIQFPRVAAQRIGKTIRPVLADLIDFPSDKSSWEVSTHSPQHTNRLLTHREIWEALQEKRMVMHYQPQYDMANGQTVAAEALLRLVDRDGELIYPDRFIDRVETSDLIVPVGRAVIEQACADLAECRGRGAQLGRVAINVSADQLNADPTLARFVGQMVARYGLQHDDLEFELTERRMLTKNCAGRSVLNALAQRGMRIVVDDFGIGYSSIVYLTELPISAFKLDRGLVNRLPNDTAVLKVVQSLLALAASLDMEVVAEGIETGDQYEVLASAGCHYAQDFAFARPMAIDRLQGFLTDAAIRQERG